MSEITKGQWHTDDNGNHGVCGADKGLCPYRERGHFADEKDAAKAYAQENKSGLFSIFSRKNKKRSQAGTIQADSPSESAYNPRKWAKPGMFKEGVIPTREEFLAQEIESTVFPWAKTAQLPTEAPVYPQGTPRDKIKQRSLAERQVIVPAWNKEVAAFVIGERLGAEFGDWRVNDEKLTPGMFYRGIRIVDSRGGEIFVPFEPEEQPTCVDEDYRVHARAGTVQINGLPTTVLASGGVFENASDVMLPIYDTATGEVNSEGFAGLEGPRNGSYPIRDAYQDAVWYNVHELFETVMTPDGNHVLKLHEATAKATGDEYNITWSKHGDVNGDHQYTFTLVDRYREEVPVEYYFS